MAKIGLFFGSFNPIHVGHLALANHMVQEADLDGVWFVVSPHNPLKKKASLLDGRQRLHIVDLALDGYDAFKTSDVEFYLPLPSYTSNTLIHLEEKFPEHQFALIMGEDTVRTLPKWKNSEFIQAHFPILVYPRTYGVTLEAPLEKDPPHLLRFPNAPNLPISASFLRKRISAGKFPHFLIPKASGKYIQEMGFYGWKG